MERFIHVTFFINILYKLKNIIQRKRKIRLFKNTTGIV